MMFLILFIVILFFLILFSFYIVGIFLDTVDIFDMVVYTTIDKALFDSFVADIFLNTVVIISYLDTVDILFGYY